MQINNAHQVAQFWNKVLQNPGIKAVMDEENQAAEEENNNLEREATGQQEQIE